MITAIAFDPHDRSPLHRQLYESIRGAVVSGRIAPGAKLPSTRFLSGQLNLARNTILTAFEQLLAEGYLVARTGSGTFVAHELPERVLNAGPARRPRPPGGDVTAAGGDLAAGGGVPQLSSRGTGIEPWATRGAIAAYLRGSETAFRGGLPALDAFPYDRWGKLLARRWNRSSRDLYDLGDPCGYLPLREALVEYLNTARGVRCELDQVLITSGTQQAVSLAAHLLLDPGDACWVEDPGYHLARSALAAAGATLAPVPVDDEGIVVAEGVRRCPKGKLAVVTPAHQFPLGHAMSPRRRTALLDWARDAGAWVVEDDYDSEFRYVGRPLAALQGEDADGRVIYCGTFSKVLTPALRLGFVVVPPRLVDAFVAGRIRADVRSPPLEQAVLADFIAAGHFARHVRRMRVLYAERQEALLDAAAKELGGVLDLRPSPAGMHLVGRLPPACDDRAAAERARRAGLHVFPLSAFRVEPSPQQGLVLGYAAVPAELMPEKVHRLAEAMRGPR